MSWRSGAKLFTEMWPLLQARIPESARRQEFLGRLLALFLEWDVDPENLADLHSEVRQALVALGATVEEEPGHAFDIVRCAQYLTSPVEKIRVTTAQAIEFYVHQADDPVQAAPVALLALVGALGDSSLKVRRAAAKSIESLVAQEFAFPEKARKALEEALADKDELVRRRVASTLRRIGAPGTRETGRTKRNTRRPPRQGS
jgi:HEAT repeat protein